MRSCAVSLLKFIEGSKPVFKSDGNLHFNMGKTMILANDPTACHVYERSQNFLQNDFILQCRMISPPMFSVQGIEVLGTPLGTDAYIKEFVAHNSVKITSNVEKFEPITDCFVFHQLVESIA